MTNYKRGYETERKIVNELKKKGYLAVRTAGSHSLFDVIAINDKEVLLIQAKRTKKKYNWADENIYKFVELQVPGNVRKELWVWVDREGFTKLPV